jgi:hypothetical protein
MLATGGIVVVVLFAALLAPFFVDWANFRVAFEEQASRILGKKVVVHGEVDARILPFPSVTLHDVRVGSDTDGQPLVQVARFSMDMELAPFLSGEARIFDMRIEEPKARIRVLKDGTLDWMRGSRAAIPARTVVIEDVHITGGTVDLIDEQSGKSRRLTGLSADMSADALVGPWRGEGSATLDGQASRFSLSSGEIDRQAARLPLRLRIWPEAQPVEVNLDGELTIADSKPLYRGNFTFGVLQEEDENEPVEPPPPGPRLKGGFELTNERIRIPEYRLEVGALDDPYIVTGEATLDTGERQEFLLTAEGQQIDVNRLGNGNRGKTSRNAAASANRRINAFIELAARIPIPQVPGRAHLRLPAIVANDTTVRDIRLDIRPAGSGWTVDNAVATLPGRTQLEAKGLLTLAGRPSFKGDMLLASNQPSGLADWLSGQVDPAIRQLRTAGFSAKVALTPDLQRFDDLELAIGPATLKGSVERQSPAAAVPALTINLAGDEIDIDAMRALASLMTGDDAGQDVLDHRIAASLRADRFTAFGVGAAKVDTVFSFSEGALSLERLAVGNLEGASLNARGRVEGSLLSYTGNASVSLKAEDPGRFLAMLRDRLPSHPVLERLASNAAWFNNTDLNAELTIGGAAQSGVAGMVTGSMNGSRLLANIELPRIFSLTGDPEFTVKATLDNPEAAVLLGQAGLDPLPVDGDGAARVALDLRQQGAGRAAVELSFHTDGTQLSAKGDVGLGQSDFGEGRARVTLESADVEPYLLMTGIGLPQFGSGLPIRFAGEVSMTPDLVELTGMEGSAADNDFSGGLRIDRKTPGLPASGSLDLATLDLAWLAEAIYGPLTNPATGSLTDGDLGRPVFGGADISLDLKARNFWVGRLGQVGNFSGKLAHRNGGMTVDDLSGTWGGGRVSGRIMMSNGEGAGIFQTKIHLDGAELAPLVWNLDEVPVAAGKLGLDLTAEVTGRSVAELLDSAGGSGEIRLSGLVVEGVNPNALAPLTAEVDQLQGEVTEARVLPLLEKVVHNGSADLGDVTIPFTITDGEFRAQNVAASAGPAKLMGNARIDLLKETLQGSLAVTYDAGEDALAGGDPTVRFVYSGDLAAASKTLDASALTSFLSQRAFERERRRVETLQASVLEKQRLRREVALYNFRAAQRQAAREKAEAEERARLEEEARQRAEAEALREAILAEQRRQRETEQPSSPVLTVPPTDEVLREALPPVGGSSFQNLPGVQSPD